MESFGCWVRLAILATAVGSVVSAQTDVQAENVNVHVVSGSVENAAKAAANMRFPSLVPNLFGAMLFDFSVNSKLLDRETNRPYEYTLRMPSDDNITIWNLAESSSITTFQILSHTANAFQTSLVGATVVVAVHVDGKGGNHLSITTIVPKAGTNVENELQKTLVAGLATTFLENMRLSVGVSNCNDITLTPEGAKLMHEALEIQRADATEMHMAPMPFTRSEWIRKATPEGYKDGDKRKHFNAITAFVDASNVYGADNWRAWALRSFKDGKLRMNGKSLPFNKLGDLPLILRNAPTLSGSLFAAGDIRANENPVLLALHTIFAREHNRICDLLKKTLRGSAWENAGDAWFYYQARKLVIAEMQNIVYNEFLPIVLGPNALPKYSGYKPDVDPSIAVMHSTASYRFGHSGVVNGLNIKDRKGANQFILLNKVFFTPSAYTKFGPNAWLKAATEQRAEDIDSILAPSIQDFLFNPTRAHVLDLGALNIMRTRDHGVCSYLESRASFGLSKRLTDIPPAKRLALIGKYKKPNKIDVTIGGLSEVPKEGSLLGPLYHASNVDQFTRLRDGDRFFYASKDFNFGTSFEWIKKHRPASAMYKLAQNALSGNVRLRDVLEANTGTKFPGKGSVMLM